MQAPFRGKACGKACEIAPSTAIPDTSRRLRLDAKTASIAENTIWKEPQTTPERGKQSVMNETVQDPEFHLAPELKRDTLALGELPLCRILLMNDKHFPWIILVPRRAGASEMFDLCDRDQHQLMREIAATGRALQTVYQPTKVNIGALGNIVRQLHIHVIARFEGDAAWPGPVWGALKAQAYPGSAPGYADVVGQRILEAILIAYRAD